ncbi:MAG: 16S rRNA (guanine(966)-N(2))-methyltransferase RsmD [Akkermansiaceae bacterium]
MRIISGIAGSRQIKVPGSVARPSTDRLREALFSILSQRVKGAKVLDLFAGSGALGLESLSRGAVSCAFVDESRESQVVINKNLKSLGLTGAKVLRGDVFRMLQGERGRYDLIFADPPYYKKFGDVDYVKQLLEDENLLELTTEDGLLVLEDPPANYKRESRADSEHWDLLDHRKYGGCGILFYQRKAKEEL